jgi:hypothetical protein
MIRPRKSICEWLGKHHVFIVLVLSLFHVSLAALHTRDSGKADLSFRALINTVRSIERPVI